MDKKLCGSTQTVKANNSLAIKLVPFLSQKENTVMSPLGIKTVLSMVAEGASCEALDEILAILGVENLDQIRETIFAMQEDGCTAFSSENSLHLESGMEKLQLADDFRRTMKKDYETEITEAESDGFAKLKLVNEASFAAKWAVDLELDQSGENHFNNVDLTTSNPLFLRYEGEKLKFCNGYQKYNRSVGVKAVALPYVLDNKPIPYELVLIDTNLELTKKNLDYILDSLHDGDCEVYFPEFKIQNKHNLIPIMENLGLKNIFDSVASRLDKIASQRLFVNEFGQDAEIVVDRDGTIAKATTYCGLMTCCLQDESKELRFTKPFHYILRKIDTGEIIFIGNVNKLPDCDRPVEREPLFVPSFSGPKLEDLLTKRENLKESRIKDGRLCIYVGDSKNIVIPEGVHTISRYSVNEEDLKMAETIRLPESLEIIEDYAFRGYEKLERIVIPANVKEIGDYAFGFCSALKEVIFEGSPVLGKYSFEWTPWKKEYLKNNKFDIAGDTLMKVYEDVTECIIPEGIKIIYDAAFQSTKIKRVTVSEGVEKICFAAFRYSDLEYISLPSTLKEIHEYAFAECKNLKKMIVPKSLNKSALRDLKFALRKVPGCYVKYVDEKEE